MLGLTRPLPQLKAATCIEPNKQQLIRKGGENPRWLEPVAAENSASCEPQLQALNILIVDPTGLGTALL